MQGTNPYNPFTWEHRNKSVTSDGEDDNNMTVGAGLGGGGGGAPSSVLVWVVVLWERDLRQIIRLRLLLL
jgi:hypothetical protein